MRQLGFGQMAGARVVVGLAVLMGMGLAGPTARAGTIYVAKTGADGNDGLSWATAKGTVAGGLAVAVSGDQVWVAKGIYVERITLKIEAGLYGGFAGNEGQLGERDWAANVTVLDGNAGGSVVTAPAGATASTRIDGFTIRNGSGTLSSGNLRCGGGIYCSSASPTIANNTIVGNVVISTTGAVSHCLGGGIYCSNSSPVITNNLIGDNSASNSRDPSHLPFCDGGGIYCSGGSPIIANNTIKRNLASDSKATGYSNSEGGGICSSGSSPSITGNIITANVAGRLGGGIYCYSGAPVISNNKITGNSAVAAGGGLSCFNTSAAIVGNTIAGNSAATVGGGVSWSGSGSPRFSNNTVVGNRAGDGGGIHCEDVVMTLANNIVAWNSTGLYKQGGTLTLRGNCVHNPDGYNYSGLSAGNGDISADPLLLAVEFGEFHLKSNSPCIDAGQDDVVQPGELDLDGQARIQGAHVDIGADESDGSTPTFAPMIVRVSPGGDDANDGSSWASAKRTLQAGIDGAASAGGEVWVAGGTYKECIRLVPWAYVYGGFAGMETERDQRRPTLHPTVVDGGGANIVVSALAGHQASCIDGFTIGNSDISPLSFTSTCCGIYCFNASPAIVNNTIAGNARNGIECSFSSSVISNNRITNNGGVGIRCTGDSPRIFNNTIVANGGDGVYCSNTSALIANNIVAFNSSGIHNYGTAPGVRNNCVYQPGGSNYSGLSPGSMDVAADPQLLSTGFGDLHIKAGSPCIDAGDNSLVQPGSSDMDIEPRIQGAGVDIGADEFSGTPPAYTPTVVRVSPSGDDANDGSSWAFAKRTVQAGIDAAARAGGEVWVAAGTYYERVDLKSWTYLYGGFAGTEDQRDQRDWVSQSTILDGGAGGSVVTVRAGYRGSSIDGFTLRNGTGTEIIRPPSNPRCGGGICCSGSSPTIANNTIAGNTALVGGGIWCGTTTSPIISGNTILGNSGSNGGGICGGSKGTVILNNRIIGNVVTYYGGGIQCGAGMTRGNVIAGNKAQKGGGAYCNGPVEISGNAVVGNTATVVGGGLWCARATTSDILTVSNCTITANTAPDAAGMYANGITAANCVVWGNIGGADLNSADPSTVTFSDVEGGVVGTGNINSEPMFVRAPSAGPDGVWGTADDDYGDLRLMAGSPCIDAGNNAAVSAGIITDLAGVGRFLDDPATADCRWAAGTCGMAPVVDMGAYEFMAGDYDRDNDVDREDVAAFVACVSGPAVVYIGDCAAADFDHDGDVDLVDFGALQRCFCGGGR